MYIVACSGFFKCNKFKKPPTRTQDLLKADKHGRWWLVGSAWKGNQVEGSDDDDSDDEKKNKKKDIKSEFNLSQSCDVVTFCNTSYWPRRVCKVPSSTLRLGGKPKFLIYGS